MIYLNHNCYEYLTITAYFHRYLMFYNPCWTCTFKQCILWIAGLFWLDKKKKYTFCPEVIFYWRKYCKDRGKHHHCCCVWFFITTGQQRWNSIVKYILTFIESMSKIWMYYISFHIIVRLELSYVCHWNSDYNSDYKVNIFFNW